MTITNDITFDWTWTPKVDGFEVCQVDCAVEIAYRAERENRRWSVDDWLISGVGIWHYDAAAGKQKIRWLPKGDSLVERMIIDLELDRKLESEVIHRACQQLAEAA